MVEKSDKIIFVQGEFREELLNGKALCIYVIASTKTSTIPGISLAGQAPLLTLFTPALDVEYLYNGIPISFPIIPTTPEGIPTPAIITRSAINLSQLPYIIVDAGSFIEPRVSLLKLAWRTIGGRIDIENALPLGTSRKLFEESKEVGKTYGSIANVIVIGESMPGGTTTAMAILRALNYGEPDVVSSSSRDNPLELKRAITDKALQRLKNNEDIFKINDIVGDPLHISIAGIALGALEKKSLVVLAGGTQMLAVLSLMKEIEPQFDQRKVVLATTRWIYLDKSVKILNVLRKYFPEITFTYVDINFEDAPFKGLRAYEEGFVKEGVGAGGTAFLAMIRGVKVSELKSRVYEEYSNIISYGVIPYG